MNNESQPTTSGRDADAPGLQATQAHNPHRPGTPSGSLAGDSIAALISSSAFTVAFYPLHRLKTVMQTQDVNVLVASGVTLHNEDAAVGAIRPPLMQVHGQTMRTSLTVRYLYCSPHPLQQHESLMDCRCHAVCDLQDASSGIRCCKRCPAWCRSRACTRYGEA